MTKTNISTLRSRITGEPMTADQHEYLSPVTRTPGELLTTSDGFAYAVVAVGPVRPQGQMILVEATPAAPTAKIAAAMAAYEAGAAWAKTLKAGERFLGAGPEAKSRYRGSREENHFITGALNVLELHRLCTDAQGVIAEYSLVPDRVTSQQALKAADARFALWLARQEAK